MGGQVSVGLWYTSIYLKDCASILEFLATQNGRTARNGGGHAAVCSLSSSPSDGTIM